MDACKGHCTSTGASAPAAASAKANPSSTVASAKYMESATSRLRLAAAPAPPPPPPWQSWSGAQNLESSVWFPAVLVFSVANILNDLHDFAAYYSDFAEYIFMFLQYIVMILQHVFMMFHHIFDDLNLNFVNWISQNPAYLAAAVAGGSVSTSSSPSSGDFDTPRLLPSPRFLFTLIISADLFALASRVTWQIEKLD